MQRIHLASYLPSGFFGIGLLPRERSLMNLKPNPFSIELTADPICVEFSIHRRFWWASEESIKSDAGWMFGIAPLW